MCGDCCCCEKETNGQNLTRRKVCCTDIVFLLLFIAFWGGMVYMGIFAVQNGDVYRLVFGSDSFGNTCNENNKAKKVENVSLSGRDVLNLKHVFFMDIFDAEHSLEVCVSQCPDRELLTAKDVADFYKETGSRLCRYDIDPSQYTDESLYNSDGIGPCPKLPLFASTSLLYRCVPDPRKLNESMIADSVDTVSSYLNKYDNIINEILSDFYSSWKEVLWMCLISLGISFFTVLLIRFLAAIIVWVVVILTSVSSIAGTTILWLTYLKVKSDIARAKENFDTIILDVDISNETAFFWFAIVATVLTVLLLIIIVLLWKRLALVVALFKEAGKCILAMPLILIQPIWTFIILITFLVAWIIVVGFIKTSATAVATYEPFERVTYEPMKEVDIFFWYYVAGLIWTVEFILAAQQFVIGGAISMWYFSREKPSSCCNYLLSKSICRLTKHHLGTIAFGSFIITLVKIPRYFIMYIHEKYKDSTSEVARACMKCCICCLWCLEKILKFLHQNAYTITAIEGSSFCPAAKRAGGIIASNILRVTALNTLGDFVLFLGKVGVMASSGAIALVWFRKLGLHFDALPVLVCVILAYCIADSLFKAYEMIVDALLMCFCLDSSLNDGSPGREYFMSSSLLKFVETSSRGMDVLDGKVPVNPDTEAQPLSKLPPPENRNISEGTDFFDEKPQA